MFAPFVLPGIAAVVVTARAMHAHNRAPHGPAGFPIEPLPGDRADRRE